MVSHRFPEYPELHVQMGSARPAAVCDTSPGWEIQFTVSTVQMMINQTPTLTLTLTLSTVQMMTNQTLKGLFSSFKSPKFVAYFSKYPNRSCSFRPWVMAESMVQREDRALNVGAVTSVVASLAGTLVNIHTPAC